MWHHDHYGFALIFWGAIVAIFIARGYFRSQERIAHYRMLETLVQKGQTLDPQTLSAIAPRDGDMGRWDRHQGVGGGLMLMCIGVGLGVFLWALTGGSGLFEGTGAPAWLPFVGIFPFMLGLGRVLMCVSNKPPQT